MATLQLPSPIVSADWLSKNIDHPDLIILDASIKKVSSDTDTQYLNTRIKGTRFFDLKKTFSDPENPIPNMLPTADAFEKNCKQLGIHANSKIVIYDTLGIYSSPRAWWMFSIMCDNDVAVLDGGFPEWIKKGFITESIDDKKTGYPIGDFKINDRSKCVITAKEIHFEMNDLNTVIIDARSYERFIGVAPEPRNDLKSGHIPNSKNLPYTKVLNHGKMSSKEKLDLIFTDFEIDDKKIIFTCGSGITACILLLAAKISGHSNLLIYDGSWSEWGQLNDAPIVC